MNGAGSGGRLVARRTPAGVQAGRSQLGSREQRRADLRAAFASQIRAAGGTTG